MTVTLPSRESAICCIDTETFEASSKASNAVDFFACLAFLARAQETNFPK